MIDLGVANHDTAVVVRLGMLLMVFAGIGYCFTLVCQKMASIVSQGSGTDVRNALFEKVNELSSADVDDFGTPLARDAYHQRRQSGAGHDSARRSPAHQVAPACRGLHGGGPSHRPAPRSRVHRLHPRHRPRVLDRDDPLGTLLQVDAVQARSRVARHARGTLGNTRDTRLRSRQARGGPLPQGGRRADRYRHCRGQALRSPQPRDVSRHEPWGRCDPLGWWWPRERRRSHAGRGRGVCELHDADAPLDSLRRQPRRDLHTRRRFCHARHGSPRLQGDDKRQGQRTRCRNRGWH